MAEACAKLLLLQGSEVADLGDYVIIKWAIHSTSGCAQAIVRAGKQYDETGKELRTKAQIGEEVDYKQRGALHFHVFKARLVYCAETEGEHGEPTTEAIAEL